MRRALRGLLLVAFSACAAPTEPLDRIVVLEIAPAMVDCADVFAPPTTCLRVRNIPGGDWYALWHLIEIEGFHFQPGRRSIIEVGIYRRRGIIYDAPNEIYRLRRYLVGP